MLIVLLYVAMPNFNISMHILSNSLIYLLIALLQVAVSHIFYSSLSPISCSIPRLNQLFQLVSFGIITNQNHNRPSVLTTLFSICWAPSKSCTWESYDIHSKHTLKPDHKYDSCSCEDNYCKLQILRRIVLLVTHQMPRCINSYPYLLHLNTF